MLNVCLCNIFVFGIAVFIILIVPEEDVALDYMRAVDIMRSREFVPSEYKFPDTEPPETSELNITDIMLLTNQVRRTLDSLANRMESRGMQLAESGMAE
jgi:hypothetical protein